MHTGFRGIHFFLFCSVLSVQGAVGIAFREKPAPQAQGIYAILPTALKVARFLLVPTISTQGIVDSSIVLSLLDPHIPGFLSHIARTNKQFCNNCNIEEEEEEEEEPASFTGASSA